MTMIKKAISIRDEQDKRIQKLTRMRHKPYSRILQEAIDLYLKRNDLLQMEEEYARYFGDAENARKDAELADAMWSLSKEVWPE